MFLFLIRKGTGYDKEQQPKFSIKIGDYNFSMSTSELVAVLSGMGDKVRSKEMRLNSSKRNQDFLCEFHSNHGHVMVDCRILQAKVDYLLKKGYLTELFSEESKQSYMKNKEEPPKPPSSKRTVNVITGGDEVNGVMHTTTKRTTKILVTRGK